MIKIFTQKFNWDTATWDDFEPAFPLHGMPGYEVANLLSTIDEIRLSKKLVGGDVTRHKFDQGDWVYAKYELDLFSCVIGDAIPIEVGEAIERERVRLSHKDLMDNTSIIDTNPENPKRF